MSSKGERVAGRVLARPRRDLDVCAGDDGVTRRLTRGGGSLGSQAVVESLLRCFPGSLTSGGSCLSVLAGRCAADGAVAEHYKRLAALAARLARLPQSAASARRKVHRLQSSSTPVSRPPEGRGAPPAACSLLCRLRLPRPGRSTAAPVGRREAGGAAPWAARFEAEVVRPRDEARRKVERKLAHCGRALEQVVAAREEERVEQHLVERYDFATNAWEAAAPLATARQAHAVAVLDGKLYALGGANDDDDDDGYLSSAERYDPVTNAWEAVAPMATARVNHAMAVLNDGKLYAVGGYSVDDDTALSSVERYDPASNAWEAVAPMAVKRNLAGVAVLDGKLYAVGGFNEDGALSSVDRYDPVLDAWEAVAPMTLARFGAGAAALEGKLFAVGGRVEDERPVEANTVERFDPATNTWEEVSPMATARAFAVVLLI